MINIALLKEEMEAQNLSGAKLSEISGIDRSVISRILNGETLSCTVGTAQKIVEAMQLNSTKSGLIFFADKVADTQRY